MLFALGPLEQMWQTVYKMLVDELLSYIFWKLQAIYLPILESISCVYANQEMNSSFGVISLLERYESKV